MSLQIIPDEDRHYICTLKNNEMTTTFSIEYKTVWGESLTLFLGGARTQETAVSSHFSL